MSTETAETVECVCCHQQRPPDNRKPCPHCHLRPRDKAHLANAGGATTATAVRLPPAKPHGNRIEGEDLVVIASNPDELVTAQQQMIARLDEKIAEAQAECDAIAAAPGQLPADDTVEGETAKRLLAIAREHVAQANSRGSAMAKRRLVYLQKVRAALAAGFVMVPNFPGHVIAIRTARKAPHREWIWNQPARHFDVPTVQPDMACPPGEGNYVRPWPEYELHESGEKDRVDVQLTGLDEDVALPVEFLKPAVVHRTAKALDLKIFDEVVLVRDGDGRDTFAGKHPPPRGRDPMVIGRVVLRRGANRWDRRVLSFLIAWFMDTRDIG